MEGGLIFTAALAFVVLIILWKTAIVVPQQSAFVVERLGRYAGTLDAGFHILVPFVDVIRYRHSLKEAALDIPAQICITRDNVQVQVDGVLYLKVLNPERTSYGISDHIFAISQLAQTTLRSEVGKIDLDRTFEERTNINISVVAELDKATEPWGVKVLRYEIKNITPPADVLAAMEKQMRAERASYGISDYLFAISQLAQTTLRSEIGKIDLDKTFEERTNINTAVVSELDKASESWGVKVLRYEIKNITPPADVLAAMEKQMRAEREKRAVILQSEGERDAAINTAEGAKQQVIKASEAKKQQQINAAKGQAAAIMAVAPATAEGIRRVAEAIKLPGGYE
ncbi:MAG TPA: stomatin-like protein, partial [Vicinamibacterales bacterium]|nr:stomatin-like protein [Vicinamibacterales bacterium]